MGTCIFKRPEVSSEHRPLAALSIGDWYLDRHGRYAIKTASGQAFLFEDKISFYPDMDQLVMPVDVVIRPSL